MNAKKDFPGILIKRGKIWHYQVYVPGRGLWKRTTGKANEQQAIREARKLHVQAMLLTESPAELPTLSKAIIREVTRLAEIVSESQAFRVGIYYENFLKWSGDVPLESMSTSMLARYQAHRSQCRKQINVGKDDLMHRADAKCGSTVSSATIGREIGAIIRLLRENGLDVRRPAPPRDRTGRPGRPFTRAELKRFFDACNAYPSEEPGRHTPLFLLLLCTGARPAEFIPSDRSKHVALLKREIDFETGSVMIRSAKVRPGSRSKTTRIQVAPDVLDRVRQVAERTPGVHVFPPMTLHCVFSRILAKAGINPIDELGEKLTAHSFRHTFGTMLAEQGANAFVIQNVMRHSDPKMTARYVERATTAAVIDVSDLLSQKIETGE